MDVDLSTDLAALAPLVAPLISGHSDLAIGTRLGRRSRVVRGAKREIISRCYNLILKSTLPADSPMPSAGSRRFAPTSRSGCCPTSPTPAGSSTPSCWCSPSAADCASTRCRSTGSTTRTAASTSSPPPPPTSRVSVGCCAASPTARSPSMRLPPNWLRRSVGRTELAVPSGGAVRRDRRAVDAGLPAAVHVDAGRVGAQAANLVALLLTAIANTAANRRFTFGVAGASKAARHHVEGLIVFAIALAITSGALALLHVFVAATAPGLSNSSCWWRPTCSPPPSASSCCAAGCFTRAGPR